MARIDHYEFGRIVVDGRQETRDLIVLPDRVVRDWWRQDGHALVVDDLGEVLDELPTHLVVGDRCRRPDAARSRHDPAAPGPRRDGGGAAHQRGRAPLR